MSFDRASVCLRPAIASDTPAILAIVASVFREYGMTFDPDGWDRDLTRVESHYAPPGATFLVAESGGTVIGMAGGHLEAQGAELHRLYISRTARGTGLGVKLCEAIESWARAAGARAVTLWSDLRFTHAHTLYRRRGYRIFGSRILADPDRSVEFGMSRALGEAPCLATDALNATLRASTREVPWHEAHHDEALWRTALFAAAGILDARPAHELPDPAEVFARDLQPEPDEIHLIVAGANVVLGFRAGTTRVMHPSARSTSKKRRPRRRNRA